MHYWQSLKFYLYYKILKSGKDASYLELHCLDQYQQVSWCTSAYHLKIYVYFWKQTKDSTTVELKLLGIKFIKWRPDSLVTQNVAT